MRMMSIGSGSSGNAIYAGTDNTHVLVDVGLSGKKIESGLNQADLSIGDLDAVLISHEHMDHISGLGVLLRKHPMPVYTSEGTIRALQDMNNLGKVDWSLFHPIRQDEAFYVKDMLVTPIGVSHDAAEPLMYRLDHEESCGAVVTDLGKYDDHIIRCLEGVQTIYLEANHDRRMLETGPYPYPLKRRILGQQGHLCNEDSGRLMVALLHDKIRNIFLSHLSHENNLPELAYEAVRLEIEMSDTPYHGGDFPIEVAARGVPSACVAF